MELSPQLLLRILACVCIALCFVCAALAVIIFRREDIRGVMADLSGKSRHNSTEGAVRARQSLKQLERMRVMEEGIQQKEASLVKPGTTAEAASNEPAGFESMDRSASRGSSAEEAGELKQRRAAFERNVIQVGAGSSFNQEFVVAKGLVFTAAESVVEVK